MSDYDPTSETARAEAGSWSYAPDIDRDSDDPDPGRADEENADRDEELLGDRRAREAVRGFDLMLPIVATGKGPLADLAKEYLRNQSGRIPAMRPTDDITGKSTILRVPTREMYEAWSQAFSLATGKPTRFPVEPPDGSVLRWYKTFPNSDKEYSYVATRAASKWYHTATRGLATSPVTWDEVEADIGNWPCELARTWGQIPQTPAGRFEGADPDDWFREIYENTVEGEVSEK